MVEVIRTKEHVRRDHGLGRGVSLKLHFGPSQLINEVNCRREIKEIVVEKIDGIRIWAR